MGWGRIMAIKIRDMRAVTLLMLVMAGCMASYGQRSRPEVVDSVLIVPAWVRQLPEYGFAWRQDIREVRVEEGSQLRVVGDYAFTGCDNLRLVSGLPATLASIGEGAFRECVSLERFEMPAGVPEVPRECFIRCSSLREVVLHDRIYEIRAFAFTECRSLEEVVLPPRLKSIGLNAFTLCVGLRDVAVPESVVELESYAFAECAGLERIVLPANPSRLGELILEGCTGLREIVEMSGAAPAFECGSYLCDPVGDIGFYERVRLVIPETESALRSYRRAHCWKLFFRGR